MIETIQWLKMIDGLLVELSSREFQNRVWVQGVGPEISSYTELMCTLFDDYSFDSFLEDSWQEFGLSDSLRSRLRGIRSLLNDYNKDDLLTDSQIIADPRWLEIVDAAGEALTLLRLERSRQVEPRT